MSKSWSETASVFSIGFGLGAILGLIFAPQSGQNTRAFLRDKAQDRVDDAVTRGKKVARRAQRAANDAKSLVNDAIDAGGNAFRDARRS